MKKIILTLTILAISNSLHASINPLTDALENNQTFKNNVSEQIKHKWTNDIEEKMHQRNCPTVNVGEVRYRGQTLTTNVYDTAEPIISYFLRTSEGEKIFTGGMNFELAFDFVCVPEIHTIVSMNMDVSCDFLYSTTQNTMVLYNCSGAPYKQDALELENIALYNLL